ncbi:MAG: dTDP-4-dehydrorhamnose reductase [Candidatus Riflebacteria bacterium]|nr:dTDP-4-dehydrorhamnose reductase [Candidatus Riflebacteria bacterium]
MIWVIGNRGMLGTDLCRVLSNASADFCESGVEVDITDINSLEKHVSGKKIDWIINCSAYTAVDKAESEVAVAQKINAEGVFNIGKIAKRCNAKVVHFSTDYVFDGSLDRPYIETDFPSPISVYGKTKLEGEKKLVEAIDTFFIFRISWIYGNKGKNFVTSIIKLLKERDCLKIVNDQIGAPTWTEKLSENILNLINSNSNKYGFYHYSDEGQISWFDFAVEIQEQGLKSGLFESRKQILPIPSSEYPAPATRPANSRLNTTKVREILGFKINPWQENLRNYLSSMKS